MEKKSDVPRSTLLKEPIFMSLTVKSRKKEGNYIQDESKTTPDPSPVVLELNVTYVME